MRRSLILAVPAASAVAGPAVHLAPSAMAAAGGGTLPRHFLTGYWHNFDNPATELKLAAAPRAYDLVAVATGVPGAVSFAVGSGPAAVATGALGAVSFAVGPGPAAAVGGYTDDRLKADVAALHARGQKVVISVGGERGSISVGAAARFAGSVSSSPRPHPVGVRAAARSGLPRPARHRRCGRRRQPGARPPGPGRQPRLVPAAAHLSRHPGRDDLVDQLGRHRRQRLAGAVQPHLSTLP